MREGHQGPELWGQPRDSTTRLGGPRAGRLTSPVITSYMKRGLVTTHLAQIFICQMMALKPGEIKACPSEGQSTGDDSSYFMTIPAPPRSPHRVPPLPSTPNAPNRPQSASTYRTGFSLFGDRRPGKEEGRVPQHRETKRKQGQSRPAGFTLC